MKELILNHLHRGLENAITSRELQAICGCRERVLRDTIRQMRLDGIVVLSTTSGKGGYYLPAGSAEAQRYLHQEENRARSIFAGLTAARREAVKSDLQITLESVEVNKS